MTVYRKEYYRRNKKRILKQNRAWIRKNLVRHKFLKRRNYLANSERETTRSREWRRAKRREVIKALGGKCVKCGKTDPRVLQIDHVRGGGVHDINKGRGGVYLTRVLKHIKRGGKRYQLLCADCNWIKRHEQKEHGGNRKYD